MPLLDLRGIVAFPSNGDNSTDTIINGMHFNTTALDYFNYTLYSNNTLSNNSRCYLIFDNFKPIMLSNGTFVNSTSCYMPINQIAARGATGIAFASLFMISIMFTLINLKKHGQIWLREDKRFRVIGRRWQWYWMLFVAACAVTSTVTGVDVDRDYLQDIALVLQGFFFCLMTPGSLAMVWEAVRHWGSWQERQIVDADPFSYRQDDRRAKTEFWLPLIFYLFAWLNFFMTIPRSWNSIKKQRSPEQQTTIAEPAATDIRFKAGAILSVLAMAVICYSLHHSLKHYKPRGTSIFSAFNAFCVHCPTKLFFAIIILGIKMAYGAAMAWKFDISILKYNVDPGWPYGLGYATSLLIIVVFNIAGYLEENEDMRIIQQRRQRGRVVDAELGYTKKPHWWSWGKSEFHMTPEQRLRALTREVQPGGRPAQGADAANVELSNMSGLRERSRSRPPEDEDPFRDQISPVEESPITARLEMQRRESDNSVYTTNTGVSGATGLTGMTLTSEQAQPQRIRSMLDI